MRHVRRVFHDDRRVEARLPGAHVFGAHRLAVQHRDLFQSHRELLVAVAVRIDHERRVGRQLCHLDQQNNNTRTFRLARARRICVRIKKKKPCRNVAVQSGTIFLITSFRYRRRSTFLLGSGLSSLYPSQVVYVMFAGHSPLFIIDLCNPTVLIRSLRKRMRANDAFRRTPTDQNVRRSFCPTLKSSSSEKLFADYYSKTVWHERKFNSLKVFV